MPSVIAATQAMAERLRLGFERRAHPEFPPPDDTVLFVATRAVLGAIRSAVHEDSKLLGSTAFENALVAMVIEILRSSRTLETPVD